jgi:pyridoxal phosphate enzyme (YggS family)
VVDIAANLSIVREQIGEAAERAGREAAAVRLVAVSKTFPPEAVMQARAAGQLVFGENRVQEAEAKIPSVGDPTLEWRLIGHLQSNKARRAVELFSAIETVDTPKLAAALDRIAGEMGKRMPVLIEVNVAEETQKAGVAPAGLSRLIDFVSELQHLELRGLMAIPPYDEEPEKSRPYFRRLARLLEEVNRGRHEPLRDLSMGMSHDFKVAVQEGATLVRLGTAVFGSRTR